MMVVIANCILVLYELNAVQSTLHVLTHVILSPIVQEK